MYRFLILDDNVKFGYYLKGRLERSAIWKRKAGLKIEAVVTGEKELFQNAASGQEGHFDAAFVDIEIPEGDGISVVKKLREEGSELPVIFVSVHEQLVREAIYAKPLAFVRKCNLEEDLEEAFGALFAELERQSSPCLFDQGRKKLQIDPGQILYFESHEHYIVIHYRKGVKNRKEPALLRMKLSELEEHMWSRGFLRIHNRYLVNLARTEFLGDCTKVRLEEEILPVSRSYRTGVADKLLSYLSEEVL